ncbi:tyrosine recombinase XerC [Castellaniella sp.]|uniref:tyrosine recombinase XerC n=1 Tax=Castellaniella sp. TaxID=1955812 RepID=UPI002AFE323D|nr:tyrosine recombinase XerC [Castellaniella sp.]
MSADDTQRIEDWLAKLSIQQRYSDHTIAAYRHDLHALQACFAETPLDSLQEHQIRQAIGQLHARGQQARSLARTLSAWRSYFEWRAPDAQLSRNPAQGVRAPRIPHSLPKALSVDQAQALLDRTQLPPAQTPVEKRDMAMFELLYACGLRVSELVGLDCQPLRQGGYQSHSWIDLQENEVIVRGKGSKTRAVPMGHLAHQALQAWLDVRSEFLPAQPDADTQAALFLGTRRHQRITPRVVQLQLQSLAQAAGLPLHVHPHSLRHSFASHLLQSAQDLRAVQELLGHANIATTQIYTRLDFQHLAASYDQAHPRAKRKKT